MFAALTGKPLTAAVKTPCNSYIVIYRILGSEAANRASPTTQACKSARNAASQSLNSYAF